MLAQELISISPDFLQTIFEGGLLVVVMFFLWQILSAVFRNSAKQEANSQKTTDAVLALLHVTLQELNLAIKELKGYMVERDNTLEGINKRLGAVERAIDNMAILITSTLSVLQPPTPTSDEDVKK